MTIHVQKCVAVFALGIALLGACSDSSSPSRSPTTTRPHASTTAAPAKARWYRLPAAPMRQRHGEAAVWTGKEMVLWGGVTTAGEPAADGAAYDPTTNSWRVLAPAPPGVLGVAEAAVWTGDRVVLWAGNSPDGPAVGATYDPETDTWQPLPGGPLGPRESYAAAWTGKELVVIGGYSGDTKAEPVAAAVDPIAGVWRELPALNAIRGFQPRAAAWTGHEIVMSGAVYLCEQLDSSCNTTRPVVLAYDPSRDTTHEISLPLRVAGAARNLLGAWSGKVVAFIDPRVTERAPQVVTFDPVTERWRQGAVVPCAMDVSEPLEWPGDAFVVSCTGDEIAIYDVARGAWRAEATTPSPLSDRAGAALVWTGKQLIVWDGEALQPGGSYATTGARLDLGG